MKNDKYSKNSQNIEKAFSILGVSTDATEEEVKKAFRKKCKVHHPDKPGGDNFAQSEINDAYAIAIEFLSSNKGIIPLEVEKSLLLVNHALAQQQAMLRANENAGRLRRNKTANLNRLKYVMWLLGAAAAMMALFGKTLFPIFAPEGSEHYQITKLLFTQLTFVLGALGLFIQWRVTSIQNRIDTYIAELADRKTCASYLSEVLEYKDFQIVNETKIHYSDRYSGNSNPMPILFQFIALPTSELSQILLQKSIEHGLLEEIEQEELKPESITRYSVVFKPSLFKPKDIPKQEPKPITAGAAKYMLLTSVILFLLFGSGTAWLAIVKKSLWGLLTGFFSLGFLGMAQEGFASWKKAKNTG